MPDPDPLPSIKTPWGSATPPTGASAGDVPPDPIPDHTLIRRIGKGSYGEVWLARNALGVYRAVKIIDRRAFDDDRPFEREFAGMQRFEPVSRSHESQLNILQVGRGPHCFYYVMELADDMGDVLPASRTSLPAGESKLQLGLAGKPALQPDTYTPRNLRSELLLRGRLPVDECIRLGLALTTALEHLHRHGLVHRDIKPTNIVFVSGIPKLADIGLVALAESTMSFVGTEGYLPPEGPGTVQADLFSLGRVLYEISTGRDRQQFPELPTGISELPDRAALAEFNEVLLRACAPEVKQRYESAAEMHADLALLQSGKSVARMRAVERRLKFVARAGAVVTAIAFLAGLAFFYQQFQTRDARRLASENKSLAVAKSQLADDKSKLAEENRERLVRLDVANGVRLMDQGDYSGALLWFAEALPLVTNNPAAESIHRVRIQQVLKPSPGLVQVMSHEGGVLCSAFSPDGRRVATGTSGKLRVWDAESGRLLIGPLDFPSPLRALRYSGDGKRLLVGASSDEGRSRVVAPHGFAAVLDASTGREVWPRTTNVQCVAFSQDCRWLAVARTNFVIELLEVSDGRRVLELHGHTNEITMLSFARDRTLLASASRDRTVRLWTVPSGEPSGQPIRHDQAVEWVVFSPDARRFATAEYAPLLRKRCSVRTWDTRTGTEIGSPIPMLIGTYGLAFDEATGRRLLVGSRENWMSVLDTETHQPMCPNLTLESSVVRCWAFSPDGLRFATGSDDGTVRVWHLETGEALTPRLRHVGWVESVHFSPDGARLLTSSDDGTAKIWDLAVLPESAKPFELDSRTLASTPSRFPYALSRDGRRLLLSLEDYTLRLVNLETLTQEGAPMPTPDRDLAGTIRFDSSGRQWAVALGDYKGGGRSQTVGLWRREKDRTVHYDLPHGAGVRGVAFDPSGETLLTSSDNKAWNWRTSDGSLKRELPLPEQTHLHLEFGTGSGGSVVVAHLQEGAFRLFDLANSRWVGAPLEAKQLNQLQFSPDKTRLASVGTDQCGRIWDALTGQPLAPPFKHGGFLSSVEWSRDGRRVLTAGLAGNVKVWDAATGEPACGPLELSRQAVVVAHYSPDGRFIVACSDDRLARAWDAETIEPVTPILHHASEVRSALIAKGNRLVTVSDPAMVRAWDLTETTFPPAVIADCARLLAGRKLNRAGVLQPLSAGELGELCGALRSIQPALFATGRGALYEWHRRQFPELTSLIRVQAATFHLHRLAEIDPAGAELEELRAKVQACRIPPRDPAAPPGLLDLSTAYTHSIDMLPNQEYAALPRGLQHLAGLNSTCADWCFLRQRNLGKHPLGVLCLR
ncbi:MAG: serine/threonine protein kinase [Verrucomicrobia bacterium]|nr:serine/threonine protein kinase [Verrucomicrobiota bacterium]